MSETRTLTTDETRRYVEAKIEQELEARYPLMRASQRRHYARKLAKKTMYQFREQKQLAVPIKPKNAWNGLKKRFAPQWFVKKYPVVYVEAQ